MVQNGWISKVYPIYDWTVDDVWLAPKLLGWDYNRVYDVMAACGLNSMVARCSPTFGEQTNRRLWSYKVCWPELWAKMCDRVPGAATAARYANTELYGIGVTDGAKPESETWQTATMKTLEAIGGTAKNDVARGIASSVRDHKGALARSGVSYRPVPDAEPDEVSGWSWKIIFGIAASGGNKLNRQSQKAHSNALKTRKRNGLCATVGDAKALANAAKTKGAE